MLALTTLAALRQQPEGGPFASLFVMVSESEVYKMDPLPGTELKAAVKIVAPKWAESLAESSIGRLVQPIICPDFHLGMDTDRNAEQSKAPSPGQPKPE